MNLIETLIREVSIRPLLWDRFHNDYNNRSAMDAEWETISAILQKDKEYVKNKWRNLRDQFQRESKKVIVPFNNPTKPYMSYYRGKWYYFEQMLFLKDIPYGARGNNTQSPPQETIELQEDDIKEELIVYDDDISESQINCNYESDNYERLSDMSPAERVEKQTQTIFRKVEEEDNIEANEVEDIGRKRKASEKTIAECPEKNAKLSVVDKSTNTGSDTDILEDSDLHFVKSLVPYLKKLTPIRKLLVRNEIHSLLIRESLCEKCKIGKTLTKP